MITAIAIFLVIVLVHGFYRVGWKSGFRATYRVRVPVIVRMERAERHVKVCAEVRMASENFARFAKPEERYEWIERELLRHIMIQAKDFVLVEEKPNTREQEYRSGLERVYRGTLRVIPPIKT
jgi:hypothetical protein